MSLGRGGAGGTEAGGGDKGSSVQNGGDGLKTLGSSTWHVGNVEGLKDISDILLPNLSVVLFGNSAAVQFGNENLLLGEKETNMKNAEISRIVPLQGNISECHISVINMIDLHEDEHEDNLIGQVENRSEIHAFVFVVRLGQFTDPDKMGLEWLQRVFGDKVLQFVMILFTYEREEECDTIKDDLKKDPVLEKLLEKCGGRYQTCNKMMNNQSEIRRLMNKIELLFNENKQCYTGEIQETEEPQKKTDCESDKASITRGSSESTTATGTEETCVVRAEAPANEFRTNKETITRSKPLLHRLHLYNHQNKLKASDVLQISAHSLQSHESCAEEELIQTFIQKLLMMNYRARYIKTKETNKENYTKQRDNDSSDEEGDIFKAMSLSNKGTNQSERMNPMDVQMAMFHCADGFLKQLMVTKLSQCQYALPLLVPDSFTQQIEFPLWTFRQINKSWKIRNTNNEAISQTLPIYKAETPMVSFFRFGSVSSSKSQLMNSLINEKHNTFFHRHCPGSSRTRVLMDGVVEIAWFCPSGSYDDKFTDCIAFCNLHGDAGNHEKQLQILTEMASVNVVLLPQLQRRDRSAAIIQNLYKDRKPLICLFTEDESTVVQMKKGKFKIGLKDRNQSDVSENLRRAINDCLSESSSTFRLEDVSKHSDIRVDEEDDDDCRRGKEAAQKMMSILDKKHLTEIKESFLPHQGKLWQLWSQNNKELHRPRSDELEIDISQKQVNLKKIREQQHAVNINTFIQLFIEEIHLQAENKMYFLKWLGIFLDECTSKHISVLHHKYDEKWSAVIKLKGNHDKSEKLKAEQTELEKVSEELQAATFGLEHIMREIGQIYESCSSVKKNKKDLQVHFTSLPSLAAEMMISGFPLELMDGDAAHVPVIWISAVLDELIQKLGDQRVFVLSVLGIQSSGKSTMLNVMFGLQFAVGAGRCTRGAFMQLVKVSDEMKTQMNFDYIIVVDTEGLCALELAGRSTRHHDNELATFVVGIGNLTLVNIFGENPSEMQDILQSVVHAFMRMKKVRLNPSCVFVHQNITDITAEEKNKEGRRRLQEKLDELTKLAAKDEDCDAERFTDVIAFDVQNDVKMMLKDLKDRIKDLWDALLNEGFVISFINSLEILAYRKLETEYNKWSWSLHSAMVETKNKLHNKIENEAIHEVEETDLQRELKKTSEEVEKAMSEFFEKDPDADILIQWKTSFENKIKDVQENFIKETKRKLNEIHQQRDLKKKTDDQRTHHENTLYEKSKELALNFKDKTNDEETLKKEFDLLWEMYMCKTANKMITDQHRKFREANDPVIYVKKKREEYYSIFQKYCNGATSAAIFCEIICQKLKEPIEQSVYKKTARDLADEMRSNCESLNGNRSNLEKHILKTLAEEEDFDKYMNYIHKPSDHFKSFIRDEVSRYITDKFSVSVLPKMKENIKLLQQKIMEAAHKSTEHVQVNRGDVGLWLKSFTQQLSDVLIFSEKDLSGVKHDDVDDFNLLNDVIR
ncbi:interferon-induced very large GTPase 1-like [Ctenopharyngodon idella]|uniref:interferon-induced very large GTPase 1-like n=1 Tax=Ctenopharyngodon idella TaxID=7959 RepID=UPI0022325FFF|nr:interferon-induced very large GTPase 1-like [Ctenopharyngodon idella]